MKINENSPQVIVANEILPENLRPVEKAQSIASLVPNTSGGRWGGWNQAPQV